MESVGKKSGCLRPLIVLAAVLGVLVGQPALAVTKQWVGPNPDNLWTNANNWSPAGQPVADDFVDLTHEPLPFFVK
jgi:hypothetical protein